MLPPMYPEVYTAYRRDQLLLEAEQARLVRRAKAKPVSEQNRDEAYPADGALLSKVAGEEVVPDEAPCALTSEDAA